MANSIYDNLSENLASIVRCDATVSLIKSVKSTCNLKNDCLRYLLFDRTLTYGQLLHFDNEANYSCPRFVSIELICKRKIEPKIREEFF